MTILPKEILDLTGYKEDELLVQEAFCHSAKEWAKIFIDLEYNFQPELTSDHEKKENVLTAFNLCNPLNKKINKFSYKLQ